MKVLLYGQRLDGSQEEYLHTLLTTCKILNWEIGIFSPYVSILEEAKITLPNYQMIETTSELKSWHPDYIITLGGDGTILKAVTLVKDTNVPIVGINLGRLGFLSSIEKSRIQEVLYELAEKRYVIAERSLLALECNLNIFGETKFALNDFTITKRDDSSMVKIKTYINGKLLNVYWADGLIVATPTGSTGYSLSCGGPIVFPQSNNFVITPIAPHNLNVRPVVLSDSSVISFEIEGRAEHFLSTLDSRHEKITTEHQISIKKCDFKISLVKPEGTTFMNTISTKLMWGLDMRN
jgi:NAD+ kinase